MHRSSFKRREIAFLQKYILNEGRCNSCSLNAFIYDYITYDIGYLKSID